MQSNCTRDAIKVNEMRLGVLTANSGVLLPIVYRIRTSRLRLLMFPVRTSRIDL